jgi:hypothetical protein
MARHFRSDAWAPRSSHSSGAVHLGRTDEALTRTSVVPIPLFVVGFRNTGSALSGVATPRAATERRPPPREQSATSKPTQGNPEPAAPAAPVAGEAAQAEPRPAPSGQSDSIDLIIDKLPRHTLVKPIPVTITPLGDRVFIASTPDLDITVTGNSLSDALLLLKQQLESTYEGLRGKASTREQERQLKRFRDYIRDN